MEERICYIQDIGGCGTWEVSFLLLRFIPSTPDSYKVIHQLVLLWIFGVETRLLKSD